MQGAFLIFLLQDNGFRLLAFFFLIFFTCVGGTPSSFFFISLWVTDSAGSWVAIIYLYLEISCAVYHIYSSSSIGNLVNLTLKKDEAKVVDTFDIEEIGDKKVFCRCWRSKLFPLCDGSHNKHNEINGDNVGPLIVGKKNN
nr:EOG090X0JRY [Megafenestra aurita]